MLGFEAFGMAGRSLWTHKLRTVLTIVGVMIGIGSVIAVTSLSAAFEQSITGQFDSVDERSIFVTATQEDPQSGPPDAGQFGTIFTAVDRDALLALDGVERVIPSGTVAITGLSGSNGDLPFRSLTATTPDADEVRDPSDYFDGRAFTDGAEEVVLGWSVALQLGRGDADDPGIAAGDSLVVTFPDGSSRSVTVAGILAKQESLFGSNNGQVFAPVDPFYDTQRRSPTTGERVLVFDGFTVVAQSSTIVDDVRDAVDAYMQDASDAQALLGELDIQILVATASDITDQIGAAFDQVTIFIAAIAGVSLLVGGIMIGTIMLISVTERTREIGVMKAIGGLNTDVLSMILLEAAIIGLIGSIIGVALGLGAGYALVEGLFGAEDVSFVIAYDWLAIAVSLGVLTGIVAGLVPARRAVKVQPVEALSYE